MNIIYKLYSSSNWFLRLFKISSSTLFIILLCTNVATTQKFAIIGDYGNDSAEEKAVTDMIKSWDVDFIITLGDDNYGSTNGKTIDDNVGQYFSDYIYPYSGAYTPSVNLTENKFFPILGNHDYKGTGGTTILPTIWENYFQFPERNNNTYYDFVIGDIHFFALNNTPNADINCGGCMRPENSVQALWLKNGLENSTSKFKVVYMHYPPYASANSYSKIFQNFDGSESATYIQRGSDPEIQWDYKTWGADIVFSGHMHVYERNVVDGFNYVINGTGSQLGLANEFPTPLPSMTVKHMLEYGAVLAEVKHDQLHFQFHKTQVPFNSATEEVMDEFAVTTANEKIVAHYPLNANLEYEGSDNLVTLHTYDVSGGYNHGIVNIDGTPKPNQISYDTDTVIFTEGSFYNSESCIEKITRDDAFIEINDPYENYDLSNGFAISFWTYIDNSDTVDDILFTIPYMQVVKNGGNIKYHYKFDTIGKQVALVPSTSTNLENGWHFFCFTSSPETVEGVLNQASTFYISKSDFDNYNNDIDAMEEYFIDPSQNTYITRYTEKRIFDQNCNAKLKNLRFFNYGLNANDVNGIRNLDYAWASDNYNIDHHVNLGAYSYFPLGEEADKDIHNGNDGTSSNSLTETKDRFGNATGATAFGGNSYIQLDNLYAEGYDPTAEQGGITVSYWVNKKTNESSSTTEIDPFDDTAPIYSAFNAEQSNGEFLFGMERIGDRIGQRRALYNEREYGFIPWFLWAYDPISFRNKTGWYHVVMVQGPHDLRIYLQDKDGIIGCTSTDLGDYVVWYPENCRCAWNIIGFPDNMSEIIGWSIGAPYAGENYVDAEDEMDDFRVYNWPMNYKEVEALHALESKNYGSSFSLRQSNVKGKETSETESGTPPDNITETNGNLEVNRIALYPNPNDGAFIIKLNIIEPGDVTLEMFNVTGQKVYEYSEYMNLGENNIPVGNLDIPSGMYILQLTSEKFSSHLKIIKK